MGLGPFFFGKNEMLNRRADKLELLRIAEAVALEKSIDKELIITSMENGIAKAAKSKFGQENEIEVKINKLDILSKSETLGGLETQPNAAYEPPKIRDFSEFRGIIFIDRGA